MPPIKIASEGVVEFEIEDSFGTSHKILTDVGVAAMSIKAIAEECGEDDRMMYSKVTEFLGDFCQPGPEGARPSFSFYTVMAFTREVYRLAGEVKKKVSQASPLPEPSDTDSTS